MQLKSPTRRIRALWLAIAGSLSLMLLPARPAAHGAELVDAVLATVNRETITISQLERAAKTRVQELKGRYSGDELREKTAEARTAVLKEMIVGKLIAQSMAEQLTPDELIALEMRIAEREAELAAKAGSRAAYRAALELEGRTVQENRESIKQEILVGEWYRRHVFSHPHMVSPSEIRAYYASHPDEFTTVEKVTIRHILMKHSSFSSPEEAQAAAEAVLKSLREGADFAETARKFPDSPLAGEGGLVENVQRGQLLQELDGVVFSLVPGEISDLIRTHLGFHIIRCESRSGGAVTSPEAAWESIRKKLLEKRYDERYAEAVGKLHKRADIKILGATPVS